MSPRLGFRIDDVLKLIKIERKDVEEVVRWLRTHDLPSYTDEHVLQFILACDGSVDATKKRIATYVSVANGCETIFANRHPHRPDIERHLRVQYVCILPERADEDTAIVLQSLSDTNFRNFHLGPYLAVFAMTVEAAVYERPARNVSVIMDMGAVSWKHLACLRFDLLKLFSRYLHDAMPVRLRRVYMINASSVAEKFVAVARTVIKRELIDRIVMLRKDQEEVFHRDHVPKRILPKEFGGDAPSIRTLHDRLVEKLASLTGYFQAEELLRKGV